MVLRKVLLALFVLALSFFSTQHFTVSAQTPAPNPLNGLFQGTSDIPGVTCGDAASPFPDVRRCCKTTTITDPTADLIPEFACITIPGLSLFADDSKLCLSDLVEGAAYVVVKVTGLSKIIKAGQSVSDINPCAYGVPNGDSTTDACTCKESPSNSKILCTNYAASSEKNSCNDCSDTGGVWTGLGCIRTNRVSTFISDLVFTIGFGIAGSAAFICILYSAFVLQTSRGNPERIKKAKETLRACITGLMLIIFSVFILRLIGVSILQIPGLS